MLVKTLENYLTDALKNRISPPSNNIVIDVPAAPSGFPSARQIVHALFLDQSG
jgi:hypothetical protein